MIWYLINIIIITLFYTCWPKQVVLSANNVEDTDKTKKKWICIIGCGCWVFLSGLRHTSVGPDTLSYKRWFESVLSKPWKQIWYNMYDTYILGEEIKDPGYDLFVKFTQLISDNYTVFLVIVAVIFFTAFGVFIYKYSKNPYLSLVLFSTLFYSFFAITGIRQTIATAIAVFVGIKFIEERKLLKFLLTAVLAAMIHKSALCFIPFYFMSKIKINKITLALYWIAIVCSLIFRYQLLTFLQEIVGYDYYGDYSTAGAGTFMYLLIMIAMLVTVYHKVILRYSDEWVTAPAINALMIACFFSPLLLINPNMMRVVQYYSIFTVILIGECENLFKGSGNKSAYILCVAAFLVFTLIRKKPEYMFFWQ